LIVLEGRAADFGMIFSDEEIRRLRDLYYVRSERGLEKKIFKQAIERMNARLALPRDVLACCS
jgi:hypothetical protein